MFMFTSFLSLVFLVWMVARIWKHSAPLAVVSILFWPALIVALFKYWGDEDSDIRLPFALFMAATIFTYYDMSQIA
jgi:hypothetical protein